MYIHSTLCINRCTEPVFSDKTTETTSHACELSLQQVLTCCLYLATSFTCLSDAQMMCRPRAKRTSMHVCREQIDFVLVERRFLRNFVINALDFFFPSFFPNCTQYNLEELQSLCYKQMELCLCTSSQRCLPLYTVIHRKLYVYMAASSLVCPG